MTELKKRIVELLTKMLTENPFILEVSRPDCELNRVMMGFTHRMNKCSQLYLLLRGLFRTISKKFRINDNMLIIRLYRRSEEMGGNFPLGPIITFDGDAYKFLSKLYYDNQLIHLKPGYGPSDDLSSCAYWFFQTQRAFEDLRADIEKLFRLKFKKIGKEYRWLPAD